MQFDWDPKKAAKNIKDHGVSFEEAQTVFDDPNALVEPDDARGETRLDIVGFSQKARLLFVVGLEVADDHIRIISARLATRHEAKQYDRQKS